MGRSATGASKMWADRKRTQNKRERGWVVVGGGGVKSTHLQLLRIPQLAVHLDLNGVNLENCEEKRKIVSEFGQPGRGCRRQIGSGDYRSRKVPLV